MKICPNFSKAIQFTQDLMKEMAYEVRGTRWQSIDVSQKPEMRMREILNHSFMVNTSGREGIEYYQRDIEPNLPWAEDHFLERVSRQPLNPGVQWRNWPWALSADKFRTKNEQFSHTYMERYWPKSVHRGSGTVFEHDETRKGIRYDYGDLDDVVNHLLGDPLTRQAYLPVWFPEDTGVVHGERVPCTLGYHWIVRHQFLHTTYYIRSCDFFRHFRDDLYLSIRLTLWLLQELRAREKFHNDKEAMESQGYGITKAPWVDIRPGLFTFHCVSMHCFMNDWNQHFGSAVPVVKRLRSVGVNEV